MTKLNQTIAVEKGIKNQVARDLTDAHQLLQKSAMLSGIARTYQPIDDDGDQLPPESTLVQVKTEDVINQTGQVLTELFDVTATKDWANGEAQADIVVDGKPLVSGVPVTYLLFLEKQLVNLHTFIQKLPILDASELWRYDESQGVWATEPVQTTRTKKIPRNHELAAATEHHPAQVQVYHEDIVVGYWRTVKYSGALSATRVIAMLERVRKLQEAVKFAREDANGIEVKPKQIGASILGYLFGE